MQVYGQQVELSVVDDVLLVHHLDTHIVLLLDIQAGTSAPPICSPLPLALPALPPGLAGGPQHPPQQQQREQWQQEHDGDAQRGRQQQQRGGGRAGGAGADGSRTPRAALPVSSDAGPIASPQPSFMEAAAGAAHGGHGHWQAREQPAAGGSSAGGAATVGGAPSPLLLLHYPDWLVDAGSGTIYRLRLDLQAIADSCSDWPRLLAFLLRRMPSGAPRRDPHSIALRALRGLVAEQAPLAVLRSAFDPVNAACAGAGVGPDGGVGPPPSGAQAGPPGPPPTPGSNNGLRPSGSSSSLQREGSPAPPGAAALPAPVPAVAGVSISPGDMIHSVLGYLHSQAAVPPAYLHAASLEYAASCCTYGIALPPALAALLVDTLLDQVGFGFGVGAPGRGPV